MENGTWILIVPISPLAISLRGCNPDLGGIPARQGVLLLVCPAGLEAEGSWGLYGGGIATDTVSSLFGLAGDSSSSPVVL